MRIFSKLNELSAVGLSALGLRLDVLYERNTGYLRGFSRAMIMCRKNTKSNVFFGLSLVLVCFAGTSGAAAQPVPQLKPYRILLVVDKWDDTYATVVNRSQDAFQPVAALLKAWSIPFDIFRLDQQHLDSSYLFDRAGGVRYSAVLWLADAASYGDQDFSSVEQAATAGTGLIAVNSRVLHPALNKLLGVQFKEFYTSTDQFRMTGDHFLVRGVTENSMPSQNREYSVRLWMIPNKAQGLVVQGEHPVLTVNQLSEGVSGIWLGSPDLSQLCNSPFWRNLFLRALVGEMGYVVLPDVDYAHRVIMELDDWGTADKGFLSYWRYLEPNQETIRKDLIEPLKQRHAIASAMLDTGYVDRRSKRIVSPWSQNFIDSYGLHQDYASTQKGLQEAVTAGVLDIESHGWTHMEPDLESTPGPWWTADLAGEGSVDGWYSEFQDRRRDKDVPALAQMYHMKRSLIEIQQDFGVQPLELKPGGDAWTKSRFNNTAALAARVGFGLFHGDTSTYYLDHELVLDMAGVVVDADTGYDLLHMLHPEQWPYHPDGPVILGFHDRDIALGPNYMQQLFTALPTDYRTMGTNQYIGILHTQINSSRDENSLQLTFVLDDHYCAYFARHPSSWQLWISDPLRKHLSSGSVQLSVDNQPTKLSGMDFSGSTLRISLPPGTGTHTWRITVSADNTKP